VNRQAADDTPAAVLKLRAILSQRMPIGVPLAIVATLCLLAMAIVPAFYDFGGRIVDMSYEFAWSTEAVATTGSLLACPHAPVTQGFCTFATRMPFIPYALAAASKLVGDNLLRIAFLKTVLLDLLLLFYLKRFLALLGADIFVTLVLAGVFAGPQFMLHSFAPMYEEGFLIQLLGVSAIIQLVFALGRQDVLPRWAGLPAYIAVTAAIYLLKSSMIFLVAWNIAFLIAFMPLWKRARIASVVLLCLPPLLWGAAVAHETGRFTLGTSIDGLNLLKGNNPATLDFYPPYTLDILLGEGRVDLGGNTVAQFNPATVDARFVAGAWIDEWQLDDAYQAIALSWMAHHSGEELQLAVRKLAVFFFDVRNTPIGATNSKPPGAALTIGIAWMVVMRIVLWAAIAGAVAALWRGTFLKPVAICFLAFLVCYAAPCIIGYAFERHVVSVLLPAALFLIARWRWPLQITHLAA
jgi:hypothetical protein